MIERIIPTSGEKLPVVGLGTWQTFNADAKQYGSLKSVLTAMYQAGGKMIDSSPMYGRAEAVIGELTSAMPQKDELFYATKVWTRGEEAGRKQIQASYQLMKREVMNLIQIHNLVDWQVHLPYLRRLKEEKKLRYIGITHYEDRSHEALAEVIKKEPIDFVQFNYSILSRHAEKLLLPLCAEKGIATIINRPFGEGSLFQQFGKHQLPAWAAEWKMSTWGAFFLKYIVSHPVVTCVIPATGNPDHAKKNMIAGAEPLPDQKTREKMLAYVRNL